MKAVQELEKCSSEKINNAIHLSNLRINRGNDVFSRDWGKVIENYIGGYCVIYALVEACTVKGKKNFFPFLIAQEMVTIGGANNGSPSNTPSGRSTSKRKTVCQIGAGSNEVFPMLVLVGDLVHGPKDIVSSGVWSLGFDEAPLVGGKFLFNAAFPGHPPTWEWLRLPVIVIEATKGEPYARRAAPVAFNEGNCHFIKGGPKMNDGFGNFMPDIDRDIFFEACNYIGKCTFSLNNDVIGVGLQVVEDHRFNIVKLGTSSFDLFL
ncbi:hypothetical protein [Emcibacter sp.]|uniref:hypothetical protein n=1 Tax=Emcibacter sp. TaxID=1979954 RepID=UPI002AA7B605|nr:hypothetical protein [Emcibacter sp.]